MRVVRRVRRGPVVPEAGEAVEEEPRREACPQAPPEVQCRHRGEAQPYQKPQHKIRLAWTGLTPVDKGCDDGIVWAARPAAPGIQGNAVAASFFGAAAT